MFDPRLWVSQLGSPRMLSIGDVAPPFTAKAHDGSMVTLDDHARIILWFYPAADTPG